MGIVELAQGNLPEALSALQKCIGLFSDLGMQGDVAFYLTYLGEAEAGLGRAEKSEEHWLAAIRLAREAQALPALLAASTRFAGLLAERGELSRAYKLAALAAKHPASWEDTKNRAEKLCAELGPSLPEGEAAAIQPGAAEDSLDLLIQQVLTEHC